MNNVIVIDDDDDEPVEDHDAQLALAISLSLAHEDAHSSRSSAYGGGSSSSGGAGGSSRYSSSTGGAFYYGASADGGSSFRANGGGGTFKQGASWKNSPGSVLGSGQPSNKRSRIHPPSANAKKSSLPPLFRQTPIMIKGHDHIADAVSLSDLLSGEWQSAYLFNMMFDIPYLVKVVPRLSGLALGTNVMLVGPTVMFTHEQRVRERGTCYHGKYFAVETQHNGTHHTKMAILVFETGVRVSCLTGNFVVCNNEKKTDAAWWQEFPLKQLKASTSGVARPGTENENDFGEVLVDYIRKTVCKDSNIAPPPEGSPGDILLKLAAYLEREVDFSSAAAVLVPSVPGYYKGADLYKYGHMRVRAVLEKEALPTNYNIPLQQSNIHSTTQQHSKGSGAAGMKGSRAVTLLDSKVMFETLTYNRDILGELTGATEPTENTKAVTSAKNIRGSSGASIPSHPKGSFPPGTHVVCQVTSLGSLGQPWLENFATSTTSFKGMEKEGEMDAHTKALLPKMSKKSQKAFISAAKLAKANSSNVRNREPVYERLQLVWPTTGLIRNCIEGWAGGGACPCPPKNMFEPADGVYGPEIKKVLQPILCRYDGISHTSDVGLHIKTYCMYRPSPVPSGGLDIAWCMLGSHNMSTVAWGTLIQDDQTLRIQSYEMSVLLLPSMLRRPDTTNGFSVDPSGDLNRKRLTYGGLGAHFDTVASGLPLELLPFPYALPPRPYPSTPSGDSAPWCPDMPKTGPDRHGRNFSR